MHLLSVDQARCVYRIFRMAGGAAVAFLLVFGPVSAVASADGPPMFEEIRRADLKVATIGWRLAMSNAALCDRLEAGTGIQIHTLDQFDAATRDLAREHFKFATPVAVEGVVPGTPAERAGLKADDSLVRVGSVDIATLAGKPQTTDRLVAVQLAIAGLGSDSPIEIEVLRAGVPMRMTLHPLPICRARFEMRIASDWSASADGTMVQIGSRFVEEYPDDLIAVVMAHELAHNVLRHRERLESRGVAFGMLSGFGASVKYFRQTEIQADLLAVYFLANADYPLRSAVAFWRKFGPSKAGGILRSRSHPAWRDRIATIESEIARIEALPARPIIPLMIAERSQPLDGNWEKLLVRHR